MRNKSLDKLVKNIEEKCNMALEDTANELAYEIEYTYESIIDSFYSSYYPLYYDRSYSTYLASSGYNDIFSSQNVYQSGNEWITGITLDPGYIPGKPYQADTDWVYYRTFEKGIHGINIKDVRKRNRTIMQRYWKSRALANRIKSKHKKLKITLNTPKGVIKIRQNMGSFNVQNTGIPKNMTPSPKKLMDREFKKITKKKNLDNIFKEQIKKYTKK